MPIKNSCNNSSPRQQIPKFIRQYLWDIDQIKLNKNKHAQFIIERVLEYGDRQTFSWLQENYKTAQIIQVLRTSKRISAKTGNFFALFYQLDPTQLRCLTQPYTQKQNRF